MEQICITLTGELAEMVNAGITSGRYRDAREMVMEALRRMEREIALASSYLESLDTLSFSDLDFYESDVVQKKARQSLARMEAGEDAPYTGRKSVRRITAADIAIHGHERLHLAQQ
jgi:Arc/MetJ-type ribon-helix-helix transcriptional regulator